MEDESGSITYNYQEKEFYDACNDTDKKQIWELIVEISTNENNGVFTLLRNYCEFYHNKRNRSSHSNTNEISESYYRCPEREILNLLKSIKFYDLMKKNHLIRHQIYSSLNENEKNQILVLIPKLQNYLLPTTNCNDEMQIERKDENNKKDKSVEKDEKDEKDEKHDVMTHEKPDKTIGKQEKKKKKQEKNVPAATKLSSSQKIRQEQRSMDVKAQINNSLSAESDSFYSKCIDLVLAYYFLRCNYFFNLCSKAKQVSLEHLEKYVDYVISFRDALDFFMPYKTEQDFMFQIFENLFTVISKNVNPEYFLLYGSKFLLMNQFKSKYQKSTKPFNEQLEFIQAMVNNPRAMFVLPWGVGVGKTALLPVIAQYYMKDEFFKKKMFYCVFAGPVRDQNAAYLYRCGIPFALIVKGKNYKAMKNNGGKPLSNTIPEYMWELQPSFHCNNDSKVYPQIYIVEPEFMEYYIKYQYEIERLIRFDAVNQIVPMSMFIPNKKKRYAHLQNRFLWPDRKSFGIIIDEPDKSNEHLSYVLENLPESSFLMSATDTDLFTQNMRTSYMVRNDNEFNEHDSDSEKFNKDYPHEVITIEGKTIGVSTTLKAGFLPNSPVISPLHGVSSHSQFLRRLKKIKTNTSLQRFLSPQVFYYLIFEIIAKFNPSEKYFFQDIIQLDIRSITFTVISEKILQCMAIISENKTSDDFYRINFQFPPDIVNVYSHKSSNEYTDLLRHQMNQLFTSRSHEFLDGCLIATHNIGFFLETIDPFLSHRMQKNPNYSLSSLETMVQENESACRLAMINQQRHVMRSVEDEENALEERAEIMKRILRKIPIKQYDIFNTKSYIQKHCPHFFETNESEQCRFSDPLTLIQENNLNEDPVNWKLSLPVSTNIPEYVNLWNFFGLGCLDFSRENYLRAISNSDNGSTAYLLSDKNTAYGLNIKITHAVLTDLDPHTFLDKNAYFQMSGRVGRNNQNSTGDVLILSPLLFDHLFD